MPSRFPADDVQTAPDVGTVTLQVAGGRRHPGTVEVCLAVMDG